MSSPEQVKGRLERKAADEEMLRQLQASDAAALHGLQKQSQRTQSERLRGQAKADLSKQETARPESKGGDAKVDPKRAAERNAAFQRLHSGRSHATEPRNAQPTTRPLETAARSAETSRAGAKAREAVSEKRTAVRVETDKAATQIRNDNQPALDPRQAPNLEHTAGQPAQKGGLFAGLMKALQIFLPPVATPVPASPSSPAPPATTAKPAEASNLPSKPGAPAAEAKPPGVTLHAVTEGTNVDEVAKFLNQAMEGIAKFLPDAAAARFSIPEPAARNIPGEFVVGRSTKREARGSQAGGAKAASGGGRPDLATFAAVQFNGSHAKGRS